MELPYEVEEGAALPDGERGCVLRMRAGELWPQVSAHPARSIRSSRNGLSPLASCACRCGRAGLSTATPGTRPRSNWSMHACCGCCARPRLGNGTRADPARLTAPRVLGVDTEARLLLRGFLSSSGDATAQ